MRKADGAVTTAHAELESAKGEHGRARRELNQLNDARRRDENQLRHLETARRLQQRVERAHAEVEAVRQANGWRSDVSCSSHIDALRFDLSGQRDTARDEAGRLNRAHQKLEEERKHLKQAGGSLSTEILELATTLGANRPRRLREHRHRGCGSAGGTTRTAGETQS